MEVVSRHLGVDLSQCRLVGSGPLPRAPDIGGLGLPPWSSSGKNGVKHPLMDTNPWKTVSQVTYTTDLMNHRVI